MKKSLIIVAMLTSLLFFNSCDDETPSTISGGGRIKFDISISPPISPINGSSFILSIPGIPYGITATEGYSGGMTDEFAVTKGQNFSIIFTAGGHECHTVSIDAILNGSVIDTKLFEMGHNGSTPCKDGLQKSINYIIP